MNINIPYPDIMKKQLSKLYLDVIKKNIKQFLLFKILFSIISSQTWNIILKRRWNDLLKAAYKIITIKSLLESLFTNLKTTNNIYN